MVDYQRRDFLKRTLTGIMTLPLYLLRDQLSFASENPKEKIIPIVNIPTTLPSTCLLCPAGCGIVAELEKGVIKRLRGNPEHPVNHGKLCAKGIAGLNLLTDPDRIIYPLKRYGKRGEGKWKRITWDEVYEILTERLIKTRNSSMNNHFVFESGQNELLTNRFMSAYGNSFYFEHSGWGDGNANTAHKLTWGSSLGVSNLINSRYIIIFGSNPFESHNAHLGLAQRIIDARINNHAKVVTFDCRLSNTAGRSDEWFPVNPGTDGVIALAMALVIMEKGLEDKGFLSDWINISRKELFKYLSHFTPEIAEKESGIKASDIRRIAIEFATQKPSTVICGRGLTGHINGVFNQRAVLILNAVAGNIDVEGGYCLPKIFRLPDLKPVPKPLVAKETYFKDKQHSTALEIIAKGNLTPSLYMTYMFNPVYTSPSGKKHINTLKNENLIPYFVAMDTHITETNVYADLILPAATYLESWGIEIRPSLDRTLYLSLRQPVAEPLGELKALKLSKPLDTMKPLGEATALNDVWIELAKRIKGGLERYFDFRDTEDFIQKLIPFIDGLKEAGGFEYLKKKGFFIHPKGKIPYQSYKKGGFSTPSGKFEIFTKDTYVIQKELKPNELILIIFEQNVLTSNNANCKWVAEIVHNNPAWINVETAKRLGVKSGDKIKIISDSGSLITNVFLTQGINPKVVAISGGCGHWQYGRIAQAKRFKSSDDDTNLLWWEKEGNGVNPNNLIPETIDPKAPGQAWNDTKVTIIKI